MQSFDSELKRLIEAGEIDMQTGLSYATNEPNLKLTLSMEGAEAQPVAAPRETTVKTPIMDGDMDMDNLIER